MTRCPQGPQGVCALGSGEQETPCLSTDAPECGMACIARCPRSGGSGGGQIRRGGDHAVSRAWCREVLQGATLSHAGVVVPHPDLLTRYSTYFRCLRLAVGVCAGLGGYPVF